MPAAEPLHLPLRVPPADLSRPGSCCGKRGGTAYFAGSCVVPKEGSFPVHVDQYHFYFDISAMEKGEQMLKAEFRVFKLKRTHVARSDVKHFCKVSGEIICHLNTYLCFHC